MKMTFKLHAAGGVQERTIELAAMPSPRTKIGRLALASGGERIEADWAEISPGTYSILLGEQSWDVRVERQPGGPAADGTTYIALLGARAYRLELANPRRRRRAEAAGGLAGPQEILAPMPGRIVKVLVSEGARVQQGESLLVMEAMKMQNEIRAPRAGRLEKIYVTEGAGVETSARLVRLA
jgi:glutaconyl-CoA/methylmalonyl-CoA decarboxylase subunit gamma